MNTSGFYKLDGYALLFARDFVVNDNYSLHRSTRTQHTYPTDGWYWFDTEAAAKSALGYVDPPPPATWDI